jgi:Ala-tRNA(Pro) deacylase
MTELELLLFLDQNGISYQRCEHPPVYTCEQAELYRPAMPGISTKNLFLTDKKRTRYFLVTTDCAKKLDLKVLESALGAHKLHFGSEQRLMDVLGLTPGAVTILALANDTAHRVEFWIDAEIWEAEAYLCHPLVNTATLVISRDDLLSFLEITGHRARIFQA